MQRIDIMVDIETLSVGEDPQILQLCAKRFDLMSGETFQEVNLGCDITQTGGEASLDTLMWWFKTDISLFSELVQKGIDGGMSEKEMINLFVVWINLIKDRDSQNVFLWGNGVNFDNRIIQKKCEKYGLRYPIHYRNDMDMRTVLELAAIQEGVEDQVEYRKKQGFSGEMHNAADDVNNQIRDLCQAVKSLLQKEVTISLRGEQRIDNGKV